MLEDSTATCFDISGLNSTRTLYGFTDASDIIPVAHTDWEQPTMPTESFSNFEKEFNSHLNEIEKFLLHK